MIEIKEYDETYVEQISTIIIRNLLEINVKDYGVEKVQEMAKDFTVEKLKDTLKNRKKVFVAIKNNEVVGTAGIDVSWYNPDEYYILTVFVKPENYSRQKVLLPEPFPCVLPSQIFLVPKLGPEYMLLFRPLRSPEYSVLRG